MPKLLAISIAILLMASACKKDDAKVVAVETPLKTTIDSKTIVDVIEISPLGPYNFGSKFYTSVDGKITKLGCRMPEISNYTVTLWDFATATSLAQTVVTTTVTEDFSYATIPPVTIKAGTRYVISIYLITPAGMPKSFYVVHKGPSTSSPIYPFTSGSVVLETPVAKSSGSSPVMPDIYGPLDLSFIRGVADFQFEYEKTP